uniref:Uncharacterized protein n=1 Tax=Nelumbo nucifera TaxID=4432 RepID=A0A822XCE2_NELNU|nr:TPA_asm: hypothetical protein HUJ06_019300 [Nelumbo nucifera]DAD25706.1 TPA_asm: hypothetical protein HUJ06_027170 [Nelumbo nucifera]
MILDSCNLFLHFLETVNNSSIRSTPLC